MSKVWSTVTVNGQRWLMGALQKDMELVGVAIVA